MPNTDVTVGVFMARVGPMHSVQMASIGDKTRRSFVLQYVYERQSAHKNINAVLSRCNTRYCCVIDDDVQFLDSGWLDTLLGVIQSNDRIGMVVPVEFKTEDVRAEYLTNGWTDIVQKPNFDEQEMAWCPGYVMLFDRERVPNIVADEDIPGPSGMSDLDLSLQVRSSGFKCVLTTRTVVYHPTKPLDLDWRAKWEIVPEHELPHLHAQQVHYMGQKWGPYFRDALERPNRGIL